MNILQEFIIVIMVIIIIGGIIIFEATSNSEKKKNYCIENNYTSYDINANRCYKTTLSETGIGFDFEYSGIINVSVVWW